MTNLGKRLASYLYISLFYQVSPCQFETPKVESEDCFERSAPRRCLPAESRSLIRHLKDDETIISRITTVTREGGISPIESTSQVAFVKTDNGKIGE